MLPLLYLKFFAIPALLVTATVLVVAYVWCRKSQTYIQFWWAEVALNFLITLLYTAYVLAIPFYSEQVHRTRNPGGFGGPSSIGIVAILFVVGCLLLPAFPTLFGLAFLPPRTSKFKWQSAIIVLYVVVVTVLISQKYTRYMADYRQHRVKKIQSKLEPVEKQLSPLEYAVVERGASPALLACDSK